MEWWNWIKKKDKKKLAWVNPSYHDNPATWVIRGELTRINLLNLRLKSWDKNNSLKKKIKKTTKAH
jgi:hypothetical protein